MHDRQLITHNTEKVFTHNDRTQEERSKKKKHDDDVKKDNRGSSFKMFRLSKSTDTAM